MVGPSNADELKKLADLRDAGVLSEQEFAAQKAKLLASTSPTVVPPHPPTPTIATSGKPPSGKSKPLGKRRGCLFSVLALIVLIIIIVVIASSGSSGAKYTVTLQGGGATSSQGFGQAPGAAPNWGEGGNVEVINSATLRVYFTVKNVGKASGTPSCTINVRSANYSDTGIDVVSPTSPIAAGSQWNAYDDITVTNHGAANVTNVQLSC